jgi:hypothetical protein
MTDLRADAEAEVVRKVKEPLPWEGVEPAYYYLKNRKERIQAAVLQKPKEAVHSMLKVQPCQELPRTIDEVLNRAPRRKAGKLKSGHSVKP